MPKIRLEPLGLNLTVSDTRALLRSLQHAKVELDAICDGNGTCGTCMLQVLQGTQSLSPHQVVELATLKNARRDPAHYRLTCQTHVTGDGVVFYLNNRAAKKLNQIFERLKNRRAPKDIIHPISNKLLLSKGGIITQEILERLLSDQ